MAKNSVRDYSATNSDNTDIQSIDISEGCAASGINNAIREVMVDLKNVSTGAVALESPAFDSASLTGDLTFGDSDKAIFGAGNDLQIYHDGSSSFVADVGTGNLTLLANEFRLNNSGNTENMITAAPDGAVTLFHNDSAKIATTSTGVDVTGTAKSDIVQLDAGSAPSWDTNTRLWSESGFGARYDGYQHRFDVGVSRTEAMRITASGSVGIGTTSPIAQSKLTIAGASGSISVTGSDGNFAAGGQRTFMDFAVGKARIGSTGGGAAGTTLGLYVGTGHEAVSVDASGSVGIGTGSPASALDVVKNSTTLRLHRTGGTSGYFELASFRNNAGDGAVGSIVRVNDASVQYNTSSDYRLKTSVVYDWDATTRLKQLKPARFEWISDGEDAVPVDGFIAHEVQGVVPEAISGTHNEVDDDGNPVYQGIDQAKIVPLLTKALIESVAKIEALEARITALEAE